MAIHTINKIQLPNGDICNLRDSTLQTVVNSMPETIIGTQSSVTASLTGIINTTTLISDGKVIYFLTPYAVQEAEQTLTLTYGNSVNTTNAIPIYLSENTRSTIPYPAYSVLTLLYYNNKFYLINNIYPNGDEVSY